MPVMKRVLKVLVIVDGESSSIYPCITLPFDCLAEQKELCYHLKNVLDVKWSDVFYYDVFYFLRSSDPLNFYWFEKIRQNGRKTVYEIDDNFFALKQKCFHDYYSVESVKATVYGLIAGSDIVKFGSKLLKQELGGRDDNSLVMLHPVAAIPEWSGISGKLPSKLVFAGSAERRHDLNFLIPVLYRLLAEYPGLEVELAGFDQLEGLTHERVHFKKYEFDVKAFHDWQMRQQGGIGLAPLADHLANRCKTDNKYREYATSNLAGVYSNLPPYERIKNGETGMVADNDPELWYNAVKKLLDDPDLRCRVIRNAREDMLQNYRVDKIAGEMIRKIWLPLCETQESYRTTAREMERYEHVRQEPSPSPRGGLKIRFKLWLEKRVGQRLYRNLRLIYWYRIKKR